MKTPASYNFFEKLEKKYGIVYIFFLDLRGDVLLLCSLIFTTIKNTNVDAEKRKSRL